MLINVIEATSCILVGTFIVLMSLIKVVSFDSRFV